MVWPDGLKGYADLLPWTGLGDMSLSQQLVSKCAQAFFLLKQNKAFGWLVSDAQARFEKRSLLSGAEKVKNNFLVSDSLFVKTELIENVKSLGYSL